MSHVFSAGLSFCKHALESLLSLAFLQGTLGQERNLCPTNLPLLCTTTWGIYVRPTYPFSAQPPEVFTLYIHFLLRIVLLLLLVLVMLVCWSCCCCFYKEWVNTYEWAHSLQSSDVVLHYKCNFDVGAFSPEWRWCYRYTDCRGDWPCRCSKVTGPQQPLVPDNTPPQVG